MAHVLTPTPLHIFPWPENGARIGLPLLLLTLPVPEDQPVLGRLARLFLVLRVVASLRLLLAISSRDSAGCQAALVNQTSIQAPELQSLAPLL